MLEKKKGRPPVYNDRSMVFLSATGETRLQLGSDRRAIINKLVDSGGAMTLGDIDRAFGFEIRDKVFALQKAGWVRIEGSGA